MNAIAEKTLIIAFFLAARAAQHEAIEKRKSLKPSMNSWISRLYGILTRPSKDRNIILSGIIGAADKGLLAQIPFIQIRNAFRCGTASGRQQSQDFNLSDYFDIAIADEKHEFI